MGNCEHSILSGNYYYYYYFTFVNTIFLTFLFYLLNPLF